MVFILPFFLALSVKVSRAGRSFSGLGGFPPCASIILHMAPHAAPVERSCCASAFPFPGFDLPVNSKRIPACSTLLETKSCGARLSSLSVHSTSRASRTGPIPRPTGCEPSAMTVLTLMWRMFPSSAKCLARCFAPRLSGTFAPLPMGISIKRWVAPTLAFFAIIDASICPSASMESGCSMLMILSSAGARLTAPPQMMKPPTSSMILLSFRNGIWTGASTSMVSAVPDGDVMALLLVFGTIQPAATRMGTMTMVERFPGTPPMECRSTTGYFLMRSTSPVCARDLVSETISLVFIPRV